VVKSPIGGYNLERLFYKKIDTGHGLNTFEVYMIMAYVIM